MAKINKYMIIVYRIKLVTGEPPPQTYESGFR